MRRDQTMDDSDEVEDSDDDRLLRAVAAAPAIDFGQVVLPAETVVAQSYELHRMLGAGAMGVVYEATDLVLRRRVAVKVHEIGRSDRAARMWREARAMARLSDAHVVTVHEVGVDGSRGFIAMELVDGANARAWVRAKRRGWHEIVEMYRQAGRGLAAAHAVGIVHRDFKPDNVLVATDGRAKVADFGLALETQSSSDGDVALEGPQDDNSTRTGATVGTPAYMAPERRRGVPADPSSDQYSFCVALYEALHDARPGGTPSDEQEVPEWIDDVLARGLSRDPEARYPDMNRLLDALDPTPRRRRRSAVLAAGTLAIAGAVLVRAGGWLATPDAVASPCAAAGAAMDDTWSESTKASVEEALATRPTSLATAAFSVVAPGFDAWAAQWRTAARDSCDASHAFGQQSMARLDAENECLERARRRFGAAVSLMRLADVDAMTRAEEVVASLPDVAMCMRSDAALASDFVSPEQHEAHERLLAELARAATDFAAGRSATAKATLDGVIPQLGDFPHAGAEARRLRADAELALGRRTDAIAELGEVVALGHTLGDRDALATAMASLARALARATAGSDEAARIVTTARAIGEDLQWSESRMLVLRLIELDIAFHAERHDEVEHIGAQLLGSAALESSRKVRVRSLLALTLQRRGRLEDALAAHDETLALVESLRGPDHPEVASVLADRASTLTALTRFGDAIASLERALAIRVEVNGGNAPIVGETERQLGDAETQLLRHDVAIAHYERAIAIHRAAKDDVGLSLALANAARTYDDLNQHEKAGALLDEALVAAERAFGPSSLNVARILVNRGISRLAAGESALGAAEHERALAIFAATLPADDLNIATARLSASRFLGALGRGDEAIAMYAMGRRAIEAKFPHDRPRAVALAYNFARALDVAGRPEALAEWRAVHELAERTLPAEHPLRLEMLVDYGARLLEAHADEEAARVLEAARELSARLEDPRTDAIAADLARARRGARGVHRG